MAEDCDVTVLTQTKNRPRIEAWFDSHPEQKNQPTFEYFQLGCTMRRLKKRFGWMMYPYYFAWQLKGRAHARRIVESGAIDLIHHVTFASFKMPVFMRSRPVVWGPVGGAESAPMGLVFKHGRLFSVIREALRNVSNAIAVALLPVFDPTERTGGAILASTPMTAAAFRKHGRNVTVLPTVGIDPPCEAGGPDSRDEATNDGLRGLRLLYVGRLHHLKGVHLLLEALRRMDGELPTLTLVGDGPEEARLRALACRLDLDRQVRFAGRVPREQLAEWFESHDVVVAPSLYESGGLAVLEGFAHGLPAIVLDCGGHALSVDEGCGFRLCPEGGPRLVIGRLADAIERYSRDRDLLKSHGDGARCRAQDYSWAKKKRVMLDVYRECIESRATTEL